MKMKAKKSSFHIYICLCIFTNLLIFFQHSKAEEAQSTNQNHLETEIQDDEKNGDENKDQVSSDSNRDLGFITMLIETMNFDPSADPISLLETQKINEALFRDALDKILFPTTTSSSSTSVSSRPSSSSSLTEKNLNKLTELIYRKFYESNLAYLETYKAAFSETNQQLMLSQNDNWIDPNESAFNLLNKLSQSYFNLRLISEILDEKEKQLAAKTKYLGEKSIQNRKQKILGLITLLQEQLINDKTMRDQSIKAFHEAFQAPFIFPSQKSFLSSLKPNLINNQNQGSSNSLICDLGKSKVLRLALMRSINSKAKEIFYYYNSSEENNEKIHPCLIVALHYNNTIKDDRDYIQRNKDKKKKLIRLSDSLLPNFEEKEFSPSKISNPLNYIIDSNGIRLNLSEEEMKLLLYSLDSLE